MAMSEKHEKQFFWAIVATETSHVFCCVLPTLFSFMSVLAGFGVVATMPGWLETLHDTMHHWEVPMIIMSAAVVALGWGLHYYSLKNDCHDHGCHHEPCGPRKRAASKILVAATILLAFNLSIYFGFHRGQDQAAAQAEHAQSDDHGHSHHGHEH